MKPFLVNTKTVKYKYSIMTVVPKRGLFSQAPGPFDISRTPLFFQMQRPFIIVAMFTKRRSVSISLHIPLPLRIYPCIYLLLALPSLPSPLTLRLTILYVIYGAVGATLSGPSKQGSTRRIYFERDASVVVNGLIPVAASELRVKQP
jgi:hypothetical protein